MTWILLIIIISYLVFALWQNNKNNRVNQILVVQYLRLIFLFMDEMKGGEKELYKQLMRAYVYEFEGESAHLFNEPWEALAKACKIQSVYHDAGGIQLVDKKTVAMIASALYTNHHIMEDITKALPRELTTKNLEKRVAFA